MTPWSEPLPPPEVRPPTGKTPRDPQGAPPGGNQGDRIEDRRQCHPAPEQATAPENLDKVCGLGEKAFLPRCAQRTAGRESRARELPGSTTSRRRHFARFTGSAALRAPGGSQGDRIELAWPRPVALVLGGVDSLPRAAHAVGFARERDWPPEVPRIRRDLKAGEERASSRSLWAKSGRALRARAVRRRLQAPSRPSTAEQARSGLPGFLPRCAQRTAPCESRSRGRQGDMSATSSGPATMRGALGDESRAGLGDAREASQPAIGGAPGGRGDKMTKAPESRDARSLGLPLEIPATSYSPTRLPVQYHRLRQA